MEASGGRSLWASFDWTERVDLDEALRQQEALGEIVRGAQLVVKTAVLKDTVAWTLKGAVQGAGGALGHYLSLTERSLWDSAG